ncbi:MAG: PAS domain-containing protein [Cyanobacteria bacterium SID2]|nr:PAS domain-containing protein [Cyanobacteria bacterium SID2]MBP0004716.1 PAS domain-containing protein [Cyanobacteria bacterium SBC]
MLEQTRNHIWQLLWEYDPSGLIAVNSNLNIELVNPAFCKMFGVDEKEIVGKPASNILGEVNRFKKVSETQKAIRGLEREYPTRKLYVKEVIFPIPDEDIIACIMVDISHEYERKKEMQNLRAETVLKVREVVDNQMKVAQEIAGLLGETTAETKVSLLKIIEAVEQEMV